MMRKKFASILLAIIAPAILWGSAARAQPSAESQPQTTFRPGALWPDDHGQHINAHGGGILLHDGTYYWFGEHKIEGRAGNSAQVGVHVYSSKDLFNWTDRGIALTVSKDPSNDLAAGCILERPKVLYNKPTGKFVMWFHLELKGKGYISARSGVAVADQPAGPYRYLYSARPNAGIWPDNLPADERHPLTPQKQDFLDEYHFGGGPHVSLPFPTNFVCRRDFAGGQMARDMNLFLDDDGHAYHIYSSEENGTLQISQLSDDFQKPAGHYSRILVGRFNEAPAMFKKDGKYYLFTSGTTGWRPNPGRSFSSSSVFGPYTYLGNPCRGDDEQTQTTFESQSTFVLPAPGHEGQFIFMGDRWRPRNPVDGRYIWLPIHFDKDLPTIEWKDSWNLDAFNTRVAEAAK